MKDLMQRTWTGNPMPAQLDVTQSVTGLLLVLFMAVHLCLESSILLGKDVMWYVTGMFELRFLHDWQHGYPGIVSVIAVLIFLLFILHAGIAVRKFPINWRQYRTFRHQMGMMRHADTNLWFYQALTGFVMFFVGSVHIYVMAANPSTIGPFASSDRVVSGWFWPLYVLLMVSVVVHGIIGLYRLAVKWVSLRDARMRNRLKALRTVLMVFFLTIGSLTILTYVKIGIEHRDRAGERYVPASRAGHADVSERGDVR